MAKKHICEICANEFIKQRTNQPSRFCSRDCFYEWQKSDEAKEISRKKMIERRSRYEEKHGHPMGFTSINNPAKTQQHRDAMRKMRLGKALSDETRKKQSESLKKTLAKPEMRKKWSLAATGRKLDYSTKKKISNAHKNKFASRKGLIYKLDRVYSCYIKEKEQTDGYASCITCDKTFDVYSMDCGHYVSRRVMQLRYDERNTHVQCVRCNRFEQGNIDVYTLKMIEMYGSDIIQEFHKIRNNNVKITDFDLTEKLKFYSEKLHSMNSIKYPYL